MPWCPKCGAEYRDGFTRCASCDVPLVDRLSDEQSKEANKSEAERECDKMVLPEGMSSPIAVYTAKNRLEAESIEEMLRDNDIPVFDRPAAFRQIQSYSGADARFGVELVVDASQTSRARQLIEQMQAELAENELSEDDLARLAEEQAEQEPPAEMQDNASFRLLPVIAGVLVLALVVLAIGMICSPHAGPVVGIALLAVTVAWSVFLAHEGIGNDEQDANVNCTLLALPLSMAGFTPLAWLVAGFCLPVRRATVASAVAALCCLLLSVATGTGTLAHSGLSLSGNAPSVTPMNILASAGTWVMIVGCVLSTFLMSALCSRATRVSSIIGSIAATAVLVTTQVIAQWFASGSWTAPDPTWLIGDIAAVIIMIAVGTLGAPYRDKGEE